MLIISAAFVFLFLLSVALGIYGFRIGRTTAAVADGKSSEHVLKVLGDLRSTKPTYEADVARAWLRD
jgi:hypothetical protein